MQLKNWVVVLDLDDTIISESKYQESGIKEVEMVIDKLFKYNIKGKIIKAKKEGINDIWQWTCNQLNLPENSKESLLWIYRLHVPNIKIPNGVINLIKNLKNSKAQLVILTDGRAITQRLKLDSIGLNNLPTFISEDYNSEKPNLDRFERIQEIYPEKNYVYIGDNPIKDFIAPRKLGWLTIGANWINERIKHKTNSKRIEPHIWIKDPNKVINFISNYQNSFLNQKRNENF